MSVSSTIYLENNEIVLVEVFVDGKSVGICEEHAIENMLYALGYRR